MYESFKGLVLRETQYKDNDKLLSILTREAGLITAKARGVKSQKSKLRSGCGLLTYSSFSLYEKNGFYTITEADPIEMFSRLRQDLELLSLGTYFAQVLETVSSHGQSDPEVLSLGLNCLYALDRLDKPQAMMKAVFELRLMCLIGYTPMLEECAACGSGDASCFLLEQGTLLCEVCRQTVPVGNRLTLSGGVLAAMRHITGCEKKQLLSFALPESSLRELGEATEKFMQAQLNQGFSALDFYKKLFAVSI